MCDRAVHIFSEINGRSFSRERALSSFLDTSPPGDRKLGLQQWDSSGVVGGLSSAHIIKGALPFLNRKRSAVWGGLRQPSDEKGSLVVSSILCQILGSSVSLLS